MFKGRSIHNLDEKGRLIVPAKYRPFLGERFVITQGLDKCLWIYPADEWLNFEQKLVSLPIGDPRARAFTRRMFSNAEDCIIDRSGRISIPQSLREYADLKENCPVIISGMGKRIEIWSEEKWQKYISSAEETYKGFTEDLTQLGI